MKRKIKTIALYFSFLTYLFAGFLPYLAFAQLDQNGNDGIVCKGNDIRVTFDVTDLTGKSIVSAPLNGNVYIYAYYNKTGACDGTLKSEFFITKADGTTKSLQSKSVVFLTNTKTQEYKVKWNISGLLDTNTWQQVKSGGKLTFKSVLYLQGQNNFVGSAPKSISVTDAVANDANFGTGTTYNPNLANGQYQQGDYSKGLVPCGRSSAITEAGYAGGRPADTCTVKDIFYLMIKVTNYLIFMAGFFATFQIVRSAFAMTISQGNAEHISKDKKMFSYAVLGLGLAFMAFLLINTVINGILGLRDGTDILSSPLQYITSW